MYIQKIFKAGNSDVVAIPKDIMQSLQLQTGESVSIGLSVDGKRVHIAKHGQKQVSPMANVALTTWLAKVGKEEKATIQALANIHGVKK